jgi:DNA-nicking Smr family endonuclease
MNQAQKIKDFSRFRELKKLLDQLELERYKIKSTSTEVKFAIRHSEDVIHEFIDLIGYTVHEAIELTDRRISIT